MDHLKQLRLSSLRLLLLLLVLYCPRLKGFEEIDPPPNRTDIRESCPHVFLLLFDTDNYTLVENGTALWIQGYYFNVSFYDNFSRPVICAYVINPSPLTDFSSAVLITAVSITSLSILASMALLITYTLFRTLRTFPSKVIMNLAAAFLAGDVCYMVRTSLLFHNKVEDWRIGVVVESYFFYTRFMWMALAGFEMCRNIFNGLQMKFASQRDKKILLMVYVLLGWGVPLLLDAILAAVEFTDNEAKHLFGIGGYIITLVPISLMLLFNVGVVILLSIMLHSAAVSKSKFNDIIKRRTTNFVRVFLVILTVLGFPWILLFVLLINGAGSDALVIVYILLNASQPIVVSIAFIGTKKVMRKYLGLCGCKREDKNTKETSGRQKKSRRLMSLLFASRDIENSAQQQEEENIGSNGGGSVMSPGSANGLIMPHNDESGSHGVSDV